MQDQLLHKAIHMADIVMFRVSDNDMEKPTPCTEWDVHMLINHIVGETAWIEPLCEGKTMAEVGTALDGDLLGGRPYEAWHNAAAEVMHVATIVSPDTTVHLSYADKAAAEYLDEVAADIIVHSWDLAKAIDAKFVIDDATAEAVMRAAQPIMAMGHEAGLIADELTVAPDASGQEKLLAAYGRDINWSYAAHHHA